MSIAQRKVTSVMHREEELVALHITDQDRINARLQKQEQVILALDGLQPYDGKPDLQRRASKEAREACGSRRKRNCLRRPS